MAAGEADHGWRDIDAEDVITAIGQRARPDAAAAAGVHHQAAAEAMLAEKAEQAGRRAADEAGEAGVVDVGQVRRVSAHAGVAKASSILAARMKSLSVRPSILWV